MKENKLVFTILAATVILAFGLIFLATKLTGAATSVSPSPNAKAVVAQTNYDWGQIGIRNGKVSADFEIKNEGTDTLKLFGGKTSCACTNAQMFTDAGLSAVYTMHANSKIVTEVAPGKTAKLTVVFDPLFHGPNSIGDINRTVTVSTNDPNNPLLSFSLTAKVVK